MNFSIIPSEQLSSTYINFGAKLENTGYSNLDSVKIFVDIDSIPFTQSNINYITPGEVDIMMYNNSLPISENIK